MFCEAWVNFKFKVTEVIQRFKSHIRPQPSWSGLAEASRYYIHQFVNDEEIHTFSDNEYLLNTIKFRKLLTVRTCVHQKMEAAICKKA